MEQDRKNVIKLIVIMTIYILLSALGVFGQVGVVLFPVMAVPFTVFCMKNKVAKELHILFHVVIGIINCLMVHSVLGILIYVVSVLVPTYIILFLYKQEIAIPNIIMCGGLILAAIIFVYFSIMNQFGINYEAQFSAGLDMISNELITKFESIINTGISEGLDVSQLQAGVKDINNLLTQGMELIKTCYPTIIVSQIIMYFGVTVLVVNTIVRRKKSTLPSMKQILEFRLSRVAILVLMLSMVLISNGVNSSGAVFIFGFNLLSFMASLFQIAGMLSLIELLRRTSISSIVKIIGYVGISILFMANPQIIMFFGCLDSLFNYRKVSIVV